MFISLSLSIYIYIYIYIYCIYRYRYINDIFISRYSTNKCECQILYSYRSECTDELCGSESLLWVSSSYQSHLLCAGFVWVNGSLLSSEWALLSYILTGTGRWSGGSAEVGRGGCVGEITNKNKSFVLFGHLHTSVFDTLKHPWIMDRMLRVCYSSFETPGN